MIKQIKRWWKNRILRRNKRSIEDAIRVLKNLDMHMKESGLSRQERRYFWREFGQNEDNRDEIFRKLAGKLGINHL